MKQILEYIRSHKDDMINDLSRLVAIPSVKSAPTENAPFGPDSARCLKEAASLFSKNGFTVDLFEADGYALAYTRPDKTYSVGIFAHSDVVPVTPEEWVMTKPFELKMKDGFLYGRGVNDDKGAIVSVLYILKACRELLLLPEDGIVVFIGSNEEAGMEDITAFAKRHTMPRVSLSPDSSFPASLGEKGITRLDITARPSPLIKKLEGGAAYNIIMPSCVCEFVYSDELMNRLCGINSGDITVIRDGDVIRVTATGIAGHAARPHLGQSALKVLCDAVNSVGTGDEAVDRQFEYIGHILADTDGKGCGIAADDPVFGPLTVANGIVRISENTLFIGFDIRYGSSIQPENVIEGIRRSCSKQGFDVRVQRASSAFSIDENSKCAQALLTAYRTCTGDTESSFFHMSGGTYCKYIPNAFATGFRCGAHLPPDGVLPPNHGRGHQSDECLELEGYLNGAEILCDMILAAADAVK